MKWNCVALFIIVNSLKSVWCQDTYCYTNDNDKKQTRSYATKTAYEVARGTEKRYFTVPSMN